MNKEGMNALEEYWITKQTNAYMNGSMNDELLNG